MPDAERVVYAHEAMLYGSSAELQRDAAPFVEGGLAAGDAVAVVCSDANATTLRESLGHDTAVEVLPAAEVFTDARSAVARYRRFADDQVARGARRVRVLGEVDFPATAGWREWVRFEALSDLELADLPVWSLCMYDRTRLPAEALAAGRMTHLIFRDKDEPIPNPDYVDPATVLDDSEVETSEPLLATPPTLGISDVAHVGPLRHTVRTVLATMSHMPATVLEDFVLAIHEVVGNGLRHGVRPVSVKLWVTADRAVCSVTDSGAGFSTRPTAEELLEGPVGLALVDALVDELHAYRVPQGFTVTISVGYPAQAQDGPLAGNGGS